MLKKMMKMSKTPSSAQEQREVGLLVAVLRGLGFFS